MELVSEMPKRYKLICKGCGEPFIMSSCGRHRKYCTVSCWKESIMVERTTTRCAYCDSEFSHRIDRRRKYCHSRCHIRHVRRSKFYFLENHNRSEPEYLEWKKAVYKKDNYTCCVCGCSGKGKVDAHHIFHYARFPEYRYELWNGVTLCKKCHRYNHSIIPKILPGLRIFLCLTVSNQIAVNKNLVLCSIYTT